jgi:AmmeMemoRadiSam system protein A
MFTDAQKDALLRTAREAIRAQVTGVAIACEPCAPLPTGTGAFVTIRRGGQLRGCLGTLECRLPLAEEVARCAARAAREDPRFAPVEACELQALAIEVSILGPLEPIRPHDDDAIVIGRHGLVVERGSRRGLLLPQVAVEWGWGPEELLAHTCLKAGLPRDAWQHGATVYRFEAIVFGD